MKMHELADYCNRHPEEFRLKLGDNSA